MCLWMAILMGNERKNNGRKLVLAFWGWVLGWSDSVRYILFYKMMKKRAVVVVEPESPLAKYVKAGLNIH